MADPRSKELNMLDGPILPRILQFTLPLAATGKIGRASCRERV